MQPPPLTLGFSPCPNDCFIFHALVHGRVPSAHAVSVYMADVEELNQRAVAGELAASKLSYHAFGFVAGTYAMLPAGGALGMGVGPLIVTKEPLSSLSGRKVAIPGGLTTANLLLKLSQPDDIDCLELRYDRIMPSVAAGEVDAGLIIHESRFTYPEHGLVKHMDLGEWWERETGLPIPLGGIAVKRGLGTRAAELLNEAIVASLDHAWARPTESEAYVAAHAQEMSQEVRARHIDLYVNEYSRDVGALGREAVRELLARAAARKLIPPVSEPLFAC